MVDQASDGRGLGLDLVALVGQVARRHGGNLEVGSSPLGGARFAVTLGTRSQVGPHDGRVLVVDSSNGPRATAAGGRPEVAYLWVR